MDNTYFPSVTSAISFEGKKSTNPLAFKYYDESKLINGKTMKEHLRFAVAFWHTFKGNGADIFGGPVWERKWNSYNTDMDNAKAALEAAFEFFTKLGNPYWCFHDIDIAPAGNSFNEKCKNLHSIVEVAKQYQKQTGIKLLWGTTNAFSHPRFSHGAGSNPDAHVVAYAAAQVKNALDATQALGGENYVFWGGREGYETLLNTNYSHEQEQLAKFFQMAVDYKEKIGFKGPFLIEPKPKEPTKHQYDFDAATVLNFLKKYNLMDHFKLNIEANHATLAGHTFEHELTVASAEGRLGSLDANTGDPNLGWDTDQFPTSFYTAAYACSIILKQGGIQSGGINFDAKLRRGSCDSMDLFYAHVGGMDTFARGLEIAAKIQEDGVIDNFVDERYSSFKTGLGLGIMNGTETLESCEKFVIDNGEPVLKSGRQEYLENIINDYIVNS
ncbi:MAG: xylose isomerase [bacterium]|nr:xylose isomerase [bacterium]